VVSISIDQLHRYSIDQYHQLIESGGLAEDTHVELIDGLLVDMSPKTREHEETIAWLAERLYRGLDVARFAAKVHGALTLERSEPEPDLFVARRDGPRPYHYGTAELVIEVSVSSLRHDLLIKSGVYARAGVSEYWVVDVEGERVVRHLDPAGETYRRVDELRAGDTLATLGLTLDVRELFAAAFS
jgi:Uma2 family endonuclease